MSSPLSSGVVTKHIQNKKINTTTKIFMYIFHSWSNIQDIVSPDLIVARNTTNLPVYIRIIQSHTKQKHVVYVINIH